MAQRILRDHEANGCEHSDFPILCASCLGENPYLGMALANFDKECKVCTQPFTVFKWRPGRAARYKKTEICQTCSKLKNVCQVCILDLEYSLPVQVRDTALNIITHNDSYSKKPCQNREYFAEEHDRMKEPHYEKNQPNVCSFNTIGKCTRGAGCAFRHEMPKTEELSHQP
ncbi:Zinc finger CCCH domain-containing protein 4 [Raphanus sativus]|nr:Zinc finger CCCH domain-containing protein 4 [Raphanus sativus]